MKVEATEIDGRKVYSVRAFNQGVATWLSRLPTLWVEGEVTELRRQDRWASVFFTLKDPEDGACLPAQMQRTQFDALQLGLADGERVHVFGRPECGSDGAIGSGAVVLSTSFAKFDAPRKRMGRLATPMILPRLMLYPVT